MPFLRRRGNVASETDMRRHTSLDNLSAAAAKQSQPPPPPPAPSPRLNAIPPSPGLPAPSLELAGDDSDNDEDAEAEAALSNRGSEGPGSRPETPPIQEETPKHRRFSVLRFRNASDSQLSLRAKQQAEKPPPLPRRTSRLGALRE
jgi:hypothetical protein